MHVGLSIWQLVFPIKQNKGFVQHYLDQHAIDLKEPKFPLVNTCASLFQRLCYNNKDNLLAGLIIAGWDRKQGGQVSF